jgi:hypothetical protein
VNRTFVISRIALSRACCVAVVVALALLVATTLAAMTPAHYTDGTTCEGPLCPGGPPPLPARWAGTPCHSDLLIDPTSLVFVTLHATTDGTEFGAEVVPYTRTVPGEVHASSAFIIGHAGELTLTWNIGLGVSAPLAFDCEPKVCELPEGCSTSTTITAPPATTSTSSTTTTSIELGTPVVVATAPAPIVSTPEGLTG